MSASTPSIGDRTNTPLIAPVSVSNVASPPVIVIVGPSAMAAFGSTPLLGTTATQCGPGAVVAHPRSQLCEPFAQVSVSELHEHVGSASGCASLPSGSIARQMPP